jgi:hypothetical protein
MKAPAGYYPANQLFQHVVMAGCSIVCMACGADGRLPLPRDDSYSRSVEDFIEQHRLCNAARMAQDPGFRGAA